MAPKRLMLEQLQKVAEDAASAATAVFGQPVQCIYKGQPYGPKSRRSYRLEPNTWRVKKGKRASQQEIVFEWLVSERSYLVEQVCNNAFARGVLWPEALKQMKTGNDIQKSFEDCASEAARTKTEEWGVQATCEFLGQKNMTDGQYVCNSSLSRDAEVDFKWALAGNICDRARFYQAATVHAAHFQLNDAGIASLRSYTGAAAEQIVSVIVGRFPRTGVPSPPEWPDIFDATLKLHSKARMHCSTQRKICDDADKCVQGHALELMNTVTKVVPYNQCQEALCPEGHKMHLWGGVEELPFPGPDCYVPDVYANGPSWSKCSTCHEFRWLPLGFFVCDHAHGDGLRYSECHACSQHRCSIPTSIKLCLDGGVYGQGLPFCCRCLKQCVGEFRGCRFGHFQCSPACSSSQRPF